MALVNCRECGKSISDEARFCPNCGAPAKKSSAPTVEPIAPTPDTEKVWTSVAWFIVIAAVLIGFASCWRSAPDDMSSTAVHTPASRPAPSTSPPPETDVAKKQRLALAMRLESGVLSGRIMAASELQTLFPESDEGKEAAALLPQLQEAYRIEWLGSQWMYSSELDKMTSSATRTAVVKSTNTHNFSSPYSGDQRATLTLRKHPRHGSDVILSIEQGQILCRSYGDCPVRIRFDEGSPRTLTGNPPADHSSEHLFIPGFKDFTSRLAKAKILRIEVNVYQEGAPIWEFDVEGFKPDKVK